MKFDRSLWMFGILSFFLALAPFYPEPHILGKIKWVMGGAVGMNGQDWFDLFLHGLPVTAFLFITGFSIGKHMKSGHRA